MAEDMKVIMSMIRRKETESSSGLMAESMTEAGKTENNTVLELTLLPAVNPSKENGKKERDFIGFKINEIIIVF
jgi:hypothetical protein